MDYEKAYNEVVQRARELHEGGNALTKLQMEIVFPELAESEDERIRKYLISIVNARTSTDFESFGWDKAKIIAYLEKQKEQKPAKYIEDSVKFEEGFNAGRESGLRDGQKYVLDNLDSYGLCKPAEWSEEDEKMMQTIIKEGDLKPSEIAWLKSLRPQQLGIDVEKLVGWAKSNFRISSFDSTKIVTDFSSMTELLDSLREYANKIIRPQPHWKPSEEQMVALNTLLCSGDYTYLGQHSQLQGLYDGLKKL